MLAAAVAAATTTNDDLSMLASFSNAGRTIFYQARAGRTNWEGLKSEGPHLALRERCGTALLLVTHGWRDDCTDHPGFRFRPRRVNRVPRDRQGAPRRALYLRRRRCLLSIWGPQRGCA